MKLILVGLLVIILIVHYSEQAGIHRRSSDTEVQSNDDDDYETESGSGEVVDEVEEPKPESVEVNDENKDDDIKELLNDKFRELEQKLDEKSEKLEEHFQLLDQNLKEKYEDLRKTIVDAKIKELTKFEKIGQKYYHIEDTEQLNWFEAANSCREMGANLATLQSEEEFDAVSEKLTNRHYWLGISDLGREGVFKSTISGKVPKYVLWHIGEPNNGNEGEHCVELKEMDGERAMNDSHCQDKFNYICEKYQLL